MGGRRKGERRVTSSSPREVEAAEEVLEVLRAMDAAFSGGDGDAFGDLFTDDGRLLLLYRDPVIGKTAIKALWRDFFERYDTSAWLTEPALVEVHGRDAYAFSTYTETLVPRNGGPSQLVVGRLVFFLRHIGSDGWRIRLLMNSHGRPIENVT
jgi:uncharacterized protein (TIGR02246 family)